MFTQSEDLKLVELCLNKGHDVNETDDYGNYPLLYAINRGNYKIFELLMKSKANMQMRPNGKMSALEKLQHDSFCLGLFLEGAFRNSNYEMAEFLLKNGAQATNFRLMDPNSILKIIDSKSEEKYHNLKQFLVMQSMMSTAGSFVSTGGDGSRVATAAQENIHDFDMDERASYAVEELTSSVDDSEIVPDELNAPRPDHYFTFMGRKRERSNNSETEKERPPVKKFCGNETDFLKEVDTAIANNELVNRKHAHSVFIGPTGSGKTSFLDRLIHRKHREFYASTDVLEEVVAVDVSICQPSTFHSVMVEMESNTWVPIRFEKSVLEQVEGAVRSQQSPLQGSEESSVESIASPTSITTTGTDPVSAGSSSQLAVPNPSVDSNLASTTPLLSRLSNNPEVREVLTSALKKYGSYNELKKSYSLYFRDAGGQVEFQEVSSLLLFGPSIFFFIFRADLDFQEKFPVEYRKSESESLNCYTSSITIEEALLQSLASVYAMDTADKAGVKTHKPHVFIVATHKDKLGPSASEKIAELNEHLDSLLENSRFQDLIQYADVGRGQVMFAVDNTSESDDDFALIRSKINNLICSNEDFNVEYPIRNLLFSLHLQNDQRSVLTLEECSDIAAKYGIAGKQVLHVLQFLHQRTGVIQFIEIEGVKPIAMKEPEILFKAVTITIVKSFSSEGLTRQQARDITKKGILTASAFKKVCPGSDGLSSDELLKILIHLHFLTPLSTRVGEENKYFIPCVLNHVPESMEKIMDSDVSPLAVTFKCDHCPKGLFGVLISHLLKPSSNDSSNVKFTLMEDKIFRDQVSFEVHSPGIEHDELSLKISFSCLEIKFYPELSEDGHRDTSITSVCSEVRQRIENAISNSLTDLHYDKREVKPVVCLKCDNCKKLHQVKEGARRHTTYCSESRRTSPIPSQARHWYKKVDSGLRGVDVLHNISLNVTNTQQEFYWKEYGAKLTIPQQSLPDHVKSCTITIKVSLSGHYEFPDDTDLVSPVFWLSSEPQCSFISPLCLEIEHCAMPENCRHLSMARAASSPITLPYSFNIWHGGKFSKHSSFGLIELDSSSGVCVVQRRAKERCYWSNVFYMSTESRNIHFAVTWCDSAHVQRVQNYYASKGAIPGDVEKHITFKEDRIQLDIPKEGRQEGGWKIIPAFEPSIAKKDVDSHRPLTTAVPHCVLNATWTIGEYPTKPLHQFTVDILGTTQKDFFTINFNPDEDGRKHHIVQKSAVLLTSKDQGQIVSCLASLNKEEVAQVGVKLGLSYTSLGACLNYRDDMVMKWLRRDGNVLEVGEPSWDSLCSALESCSHCGIASDIRKKMKS